MPRSRSRQQFKNQITDTAVLKHMVGKSVWKVYALGNISFIHEMTVHSESNSRMFLGAENVDEPTANTHKLFRDKDNAINYCDYLLRSSEQNE